MAHNQQHIDREYRDDPEFGDLSKSLASAQVTEQYNEKPDDVGFRSIYYKARRNRKLSGIIVVCTIFILFIFSKASHHVQIHGQTSSTSTAEHPILGLARENQKSFDQMVARQSKTLEEAVQQYRKRYNRRPPPGFGDWYRFASERNFVLIDEFDLLMNDLEPFWGLSPSTLLGRIEARDKFGGGVLMTFNSTGIYNSTDYVQGTGLRRWMENVPWQDIAPEVKLMIDGNDEPTVVAPYERIAEASESAMHQRSSIDGISPPLGREATDVVVTEVWSTSSDPWPEMSKVCPVSDLVNESPALDFEFAPLPFIRNTSDNFKSMDICKNPYIRTHHGMFMRKTEFKMTQTLVPVLSHAKPTRFGDIRIPSTFYDTVDREYKSPAPVPWEEKVNRVYWVGRPWSGYAFKDTWRNLQRQRMVLQTSGNNNDSVSLLRRSSDAFGRTTWVPDLSKVWADLANYFHIRIGKIPNCRWNIDITCEEIDAVIPPITEEMGTDESSKYVIDLDGYGFSGRYHRLLKSKSAVMKQTVLSEYSDQWLAPWVHYIPITLEATELGEVTRFLLEEPEGDVLGKKIAEQGSAWANSIMRVEDSQIYMLRVMMEMHRLLSENRNDLFYQ